MYIESVEVAQKWNLICHHGVIVSCLEYVVLGRTFLMENFL